MCRADQAFYGALLQLRLKIRTWMPWHRPRDTIVPIEELSPEEFIPGHSQPLMAGEASTQDSIVGQMEKDLQHQAVWQGRDMCHPDILTSSMGINKNKEMLLVNKCCFNDRRNSTFHMPAFEQTYLS